MVSAVLGGIRSSCGGHPAQQAGSANAPSPHPHQPAPLPGGVLSWPVLGPSLRQLEQAVRQQAVVGIPAPGRQARIDADGAALAAGWAVVPATPWSPGPMHALAGVLGA